MDKIEAIGAFIHQQNEAEKRAAFRPSKSVAELEAENAALRAELAKEEEAHFKTHNWLIDRNEELAAARKDAERYRWLRDECIPEKNPNHTWIVESPGEEWDAAIDEAIRKEKTE
jgi:hypothetical protein